MAQTLLFYDLETSGLAVGFDQLIQFAAIRTDLELNELERHEITARLSIDVVPSPGAVLTHRIDPKSFDRGVIEVDAVREIHRLLNVPGTLSGGYNTLGFDDEFLRFSFHRNLLPPYTHQYANGCGRFDLYPLAVLYYLYAPEVCQWPEVDGRPSLKLEGLSRANSLADGPAHQAIVDVEATLALAKLWRGKRSDIWEHGFAGFTKATDEARVHKIMQGAGEHKLALLLNGTFGAKNTYQAPVLALGAHNHYRNQTLWLRLDQPLGLDYNDWYVVKKKFGEAPLAIPYGERALRRLREDAQREVATNLQFLETNPGLLAEAKRHFVDFKYPEVGNCDVDTNLYQCGFPNYTEQGLAREFAGAGLGGKIGKLSQLADVGMRARAVRVVGRQLFSQDQELNPLDMAADEVSGLLVGLREYLRNSSDDLEDVRSWLVAVHGSEPTELVGLRGKPRYSLVQALQEIDDLLAQSDGLSDGGSGVIDKVEAVNNSNMHQLGEGDCELLLALRGFLQDRIALIESHEGLKL